MGDGAVLRIVRSGECKSVPRAHAEPAVVPRPPWNGFSGDGGSRVGHGCALSNGPSVHASCPDVALGTDAWRGVPAWRSQHGACGACPLFRVGGSGVAPIVAAS